MLISMFMVLCNRQVLRLKTCAMNYNDPLLCYRIGYGNLFSLYPRTSLSHRQKTVHDFGHSRFGYYTYT